MSVKPRRVFMAGYYGMGNFGDDLFAESVRSAALWPGAQVRSFTPSSIGSWSRLDPVGQAARLAITLRGAAWADTVAECGGSVFTSMSGNARVRGTLPGRRREALGVSVGPFADARAERRIHAHLQRLERLVVRDRASLARTAHPAVVGGDLVALHPGLSAPTQRRNVLTVCPSAASHVPVDRLSVAVQRAAAAVAVECVEVIALNAHPVLGDQARSAWLADHLERRGLRARVLSYQPGHPAPLIDSLASSRAVWSERLHGAIVAYLCETPFALVGHHAKCRDFASDIGLDASRLIDGADLDFRPAAAALEQPAWTLSPAEYRDRARAAYLETA